MTAISNLDADELETLRTAEARHQMKLRPIMVERHLRALAESRNEAKRLRFALERIADGQADDPVVNAKVALGRLPMAALLMHRDGKPVGSEREES